MLPDLWKLWIQYSTGTLLHNDPQQSTKLKQLAATHSKEIKVLMIFFLIKNYFQSVYSLTKFCTGCHSSGRRYFQKH